jgi:hypothetical protein
LAVDFLAVERLAVDLLAVERFAVDLLAVERLAVDFFAVERFAVERFAVDFFAVEREVLDFFRDDVPPLRDDDPPPLRDEELDLEDEPDFVSPDAARCLLTVRAAISFARFVERPCFFSESLTCSYCRSRFALHESGM